MPRIVAVFGGNGVDGDVAAAARAVANEVAKSHAIVLSGGDGTDDRGHKVKALNVKDEANAAARVRGRWVSVLNTRSTEP